MKTNTIFSLVFFLLYAGCCRPSVDPAKVFYTGARASNYGIRPFPEPDDWGRALRVMKSKFKDSKPALLWILGTVARQRGVSVCNLNFPGNGKFEEGINHLLPFDGNKKYFEYFDKHGISVFIQVEPGTGDVLRLIDITLSRYKKYSCVVGFGVDIEWYKTKNTEGRGLMIDDKTAEIWEKRVKSYNPNYRLYLKHWLVEWFPPKYRGDIIFVNDTQSKNESTYEDETFPTLEAMEKYYTKWAKHVYPNTVFLQIGYRLNHNLWGDMEEPIVEFGDALSKNIKQNYSIFWVDFTLQDVLPVRKKNS